MAHSVLIIQRRLPKYRLELFEHMKTLLNGQNVQLLLLHGTPSQDDSARQDEGFLPWALRAPCSYMGGGARAVWLSIPADIIRQQDLIIMPHEIGLMTNYRLLAGHIVRRKPKLAFWGHGANFQNDRNGGLKKWLREWSMKQANWWFAYTSASVKRLTESGYPEARITCLNNATDTRAIIGWAKSISSEEKTELRNQLSLLSSKIGIYIGSLHRDKRLEFFYAASDEMRKKVPDFELIIIGDGPMRDGVSAFVKARPWVKWVGAKHGREKVLYASLGQVMLNPGMVGLGILDSFALGIPMVTTDCGIHSPEIAYLENGRNGVIVPNKQEEYVKCVAGLFDDTLRRERLKLNCLKDAQKYTLDNMVNNFCNGILLAFKN